ncbi:type 1 periplasmic-binding domain-containing protein [Tessaracoccus coleopterorum]|uniref:hypothetical protein n=1 Tax=Tessaracoccus coleopterorum TaxID=2714950 RepID=UPI0022B21E4D|nr:hypothetical protein [Tessaracoccus coleopterorum]
MSGFEAAAADGGASVMLVLTRGRADAEGPVRRLAGRVDAMAVMAGTDVHSSTLEALRNKLPVVTIAGGSGPDSFSTENTASAGELTGHLIDEHGRRRLVFLGDPRRPPTSTSVTSALCAPTATVA